ncbi:MAG: DNA topoisomerase VI subunit B [Candidatus Woesearchaeota archaeon]|nr:DNA topoisomerase VI subunit B [Candidatus Woesearchaeota archaeon]MDP7324128.1 DNA topoisomerase VI subunit B [Candidatus Woesearchaeota archaeon]MDP7458173.1 DNA topoisomerase VI subunit B [Candidatus Woesearchaeota archaeon]
MNQISQKRTAEEMSKSHRDISVSQFFEKNRHLLGFDNKRKALMTTIKEAVDNSLDACEDAGILPEISVEIIDMQNDRFRVIVEDNGPGIIKVQIPKVFAKLLYGSKFHKMRQSRGQQGIGISASVMYAQLTTGRPAKITSTTSKKEKAHYYELHIDTQKNKPEIIKDETTDWKKDHGTRVELDLEASYQGGFQSVDEYLKETAIVNPHLTLIYTNPKAEQIIFPRATKDLPKEAKEIKPHPYGVELGILIKMIRSTESRTLQSFLTSEFSRVGSGTAKNICQNGSLLPNTKPKTMSREQVEQLMEGIKKTRLIAPPSNCLSPITSDLLEKGLKKEINAEFYTAVTRPTAVYRGNPFQIEIGIAYGGNQTAENQIRLIRFANRVPLLYQQGACAFTKSAIQTAWRNYGLSQSKGALPAGPVTCAIHISSVWVPYTSESKEALAHYPEIIKEIKLALQEAGRQLGSYVNKKKRIHAEGAKRDYIQKFIPHVSAALKELLKLKGVDEDKITKNLKAILETKRGKLDNVKFDPSKNVEYDPELAKIGKENNNDVGYEEPKDEKGQKKLSSFKN